MIEIKKRGENWEAYVDGALYEYSSSLELLLHFLYQYSDSIEKELTAQP